MNKSHARSRHHGWTLTELMIVMAILAVLAALAYPAFTDQVRKARRADGHQMLLEAAQRQQQYYTANSTFADTAAKLNLPTTSSEGHYTLTVAGGATTYTLTAAPSGDQAKDKCGSLTINQVGTKGVSGGSLAASKCW